MKLISSLFLLVVLSVPQSIDSLSLARKVLAPENHIANFQDVFVMPDKTKSQLFNDQIQAINLLAKSGTAKDIGLLIPYLDYPGSGAYQGTKGFQSMDTIKSEWPALGAILDIPNSEEAIASYVMDEKNPLNYRLTALQVLKYKDAKMFGALVEQLEAAVAPNLGAMDFLNYIKAPYAHFMGIANLKESSK